MISIILIVLAGICCAVMDVLSFRYNTSIFRLWKNQQWINPSVSWKNKWEYISGIEIGEKFIGSSTIFVFVTDFWHFSKFIMLMSIMGAIVFYHPIINWWVDLLLTYSVFTVIFEIFYSKIFIKK